MAMDSQSIPDAMAESPLEENLEKEKENDETKIENHVKGQDKDELGTHEEMHERRERNEVDDAGKNKAHLEMETESNAATIKNDVNELARDELGLKKEMLEGGESNEVDNAGRNNEQLEMETESDAAMIKNDVNELARDELRKNKKMLERRESNEVDDAGSNKEDLEMETESDTAMIKNDANELARDELGLRNEMLEGGERSEKEDAISKNVEDEVELEKCDELEEGELVEEDQSEMAGEFAKVAGTLEEVEVEHSNLENDVEIKTVEEAGCGDEGGSNGERKEGPEIKQLKQPGEDLLVPLTAEEIISNDAEKRELKAFKAHRWLDENFNGSDSSNDEEPGQELKIEFGQSDSDTERPQMTVNKPQNQKKQNLKTRGEIDLEDLPPIDKLQITVGDDVQLVEVGAVLHNVGVLVVVESKPNLPPLDAETVLFLEGKKVLGKVFDTIGRVIRPCYTVRFNNVADIEEQGIKDGMPVFYAPQSEEWTHYVFMTHVMKFRGSDASWEHDNEPPPQFLEYSDDEAEKQAKAKLRGKPEENSGSPAANESRGKRRKKNANQQNQSFGNSTNVNKGQSNAVQGGEDRTITATEWGTNQPLTSWPPKPRASRPREPAMRHRWARPPAHQPPSAVQFPGMPPPMIPFPDLNQPPPLSNAPSHPPSPFGPPLPPSHMHAVPPPSGPVFQMRPPSFSQGPPSSPWRAFQNAPPYSFTSPPPAPQPPAFYPSQFPPSQNGVLHLAYGSTSQLPQPAFGPPAFFHYRGPSRH